MAKEVDVRKGNVPTLPDMMPNLERMVESFFGDRFGSVLADWPVVTPRMSMDVRETERAYVMSIDLPGFSQDEIEIAVNGNLLNISAEHQEKTERQRQQRSFRQSFTLPTHVEADKIEANCENGILEVYIPKAESVAAKKIQVQKGKGGFLNRLLGKDDKTDVAQQQSKEKH